jgi:hypothetical protein
MSTQKNEFFTRQLLTERESDSSEDHYAICIADPNGVLRQYLMDLHSRHPERLPAGFEQGFIFHDKTCSIKQRILTRLLRLMATGQLYPVRPSFLMPSMTAGPRRLYAMCYFHGRHCGKISLLGNRLPLEVRGYGTQKHYGRRTPDPG